MVCFSVNLDHVVKMKERSGTQQASRLIEKTIFTSPIMGITGFRYYAFFINHKWTDVKGYIMGKNSQAEFVSLDVLDGEWSDIFARRLKKTAINSFGIFKIIVVEISLL